MLVRGRVYGCEESFDDAGRVVWKVKVQEETAKELKLKFYPDGSAVSAGAPVFGDVLEGIARGLSSWSPKDSHDCFVWVVMERFNVGDKEYSSEKRQFNGRSQAAAAR